MTSLVLANAILDALYGSGAPATIYFGLFTSAPASDGTGGTEVTGGSYARVAVTNNATNFPAAAARQKSNGTAIVFAAATAGWGTVTHAMAFDSLTGGARYDFAPLDVARTILSGDTFSIAPTQFVVTQD